jgi:ABC-2 type transport system ATP-binding protein
VIPSISVQGVTKRFGETTAVADLDLEIPAGSLTGFLGPNGAGKSTAIRMIMSIIYPDSGTINVLGSTALNAKDRIGYLPEERGVYRKMKVHAYLAYIARLKGLSRRDAATATTQWLETVELGDTQKKRCEDLSKGMQQKVQFAAAVIHDPDLLILDEPFTGLDPVNARLIGGLIHEMHAQGRTIIFSTHVLHQAEQICDRIVMINDGRKVLDDSLQGIRDRFDPRTVMVEPMNSDGEIPGLSQLQGVQAVRAVDAQPGWELELAPDADPHLIMRAASELAPMRGLWIRQLSLEEVFIRQVEEDAGRDAATAAREALRDG